MPKRRNGCTPLRTQGNEALSDERLAVTGPRGRIRPAIANIGDPPTLLQPLVRNGLILTAFSRKMQPLVDILLEHDVAARHHPRFFTILERLVRMDRAEAGIELLLQQR